MEELKIYCNICGEPLGEILEHHIEEHNYKGEQNENSSINIRLHNSDTKRIHSNGNIGKPRFTI